MRGLLREELGFAGVINSDAMNMQAIAQGPGLLIDALAAAAAGVDLLLLIDEGDEQGQVFALRGGQFHEPSQSGRAQQQPCDVVSCPRGWIARHC